MNEHYFPQADIIYQYDGSFEGFLSCVFLSFAQKETPFAVWDDRHTETSFFPITTITTDTAQAARVWQGLAKKVGVRAQVLLSTSFLSCNDTKDFVLLRFVQLCFSVGKNALYALGDVTTSAVMDLEKAVSREAHQYKGFARFEEHQGMLGAVIAPKNAVLPLLRGHFCNRFPEEDFMIYDETHQCVLLHQNHHAEIIALAAPLQMPAPDEKERNYQAMWTQFYNTIAITERENAACRRNHCPKRYWAKMTELRDTV